MARLGADREAELLLADDRSGLQSGGSFALDNLWPGEPAPHTGTLVLHLLSRRRLVSLCAFSALEMDGSLHELLRVLVEAYVAARATGEATRTSAWQRCAGVRHSRRPMCPRARPNPALRCAHCLLRTPWCICPEIPCVVAATEIVILQHQLEAQRPSSTGRLAARALSRSRVVLFGSRSDARRPDLAGFADAWLLYPGGPAEPPAGAPGSLVVLDASWREARRMFRSLPALWTLPRLSLPPKANPPLRLRRTSGDTRRSTLESIADAVALLEGDGVAAPLRELHGRFVERSLKARGAFGYRGPRAPKENA